MKKVQTVFTCDRCGTQATEYGDRQHPPTQWSSSTLDVIDTHGTPSIEQPLLCGSCRASLNVWLDEVAS